MGKLQNTISNLFHLNAGFSENNVDIFNNIYGHDNIKHIIQLAIKSEQPVHVLLTGEPGCGKTKFLENIKIRYKDKSYFTIGAHSTKAGMLDYLFENHPKIILIDEIEHMSIKDQTVLLSLMQSRILSETKYRKTRQTQLKCSVFATSNSTKKMLDPLLSRFVIIKVEKYSYEEFRDVAMEVLAEIECIEDENLARTIINKVWQKSDNANIRDVVKIARLAKNMYDIELISRTIFS
jgi:Holliday junction DNA helicase RuvB